MHKKQKPNLYVLHLMIFFKYWSNYVERYNVLKTCFYNFNVFAQNSIIKHHF